MPSRTSSLHNLLYTSSTANSRPLRRAVSGLIFYWYDTACSTFKYSTFYTKTKPSEYDGVGVVRNQIHLAVHKTTHIHKTTVSCAK